MVRSTYGIWIGALCIVIYFVDSIFIIFGLSQLSEIEKDYNSALVTSLLVIGLILCILMIIFSALLIAGIKRNRHKLIAPWMYLTIIIIVFNIIQLIFYIIEGKNVVSILVSLAIQTFVLFPIYLVYNEIKAGAGSAPRP